MAQSQNMGIGVIGDRNVVLARKYRWTLFAEHWGGKKSMYNGSLEFWVRKVKVDLIKRKIRFGVYVTYVDEHDNPVYDWLSHIAAKAYKENLFLTTFDGLGQALDRLEIDVRDVLRQSLDYDYDSSDASMLNITFSFDRYKRTCCIGKGSPEEGVPGTNYRWMFCFADSSGNEIEKEVTISKRPVLKIEETSINHLHGKMWIPGRGEWEELVVTPVSLEDWQLFVPVGKCSVVLYDNDRKLETWDITSTSLKMEGRSLRMRYNDIIYRCEDLQTVPKSPQGVSEALQVLPWFYQTT